MREAEAKFAAPPELRLPRRWNLEGVTVRPGRRAQLTTQYHDTPDLRLARWGASLRYRASEGWTVKLPESTTGNVLTRAEHRFPGRKGNPPPEAIDLVRAYVRRSPVQPVTRMRTIRTSFSLLDEGGREVAELVDDRVSVEQGPEPGQRFREIEVELRDGAPAELIDRVAGRLGTVERHLRPKLSRALGPPAEGPPDVVEPKVASDGKALEVVRAAIATSVRRLLESDAGARLGEDPEGVHQCRVAVRRLRSDLQTFDPLLDGEWVGGLRKELKWLADSLGTVRDTDVLLDGFRRRVSELPARLRRPADRLLKSLAEESLEARQRMLQGLRSERYAILLDVLVEAARLPRVSARAQEPAAELVPALAAEPCRRLRDAADELGEDPTEEDLHRLRIRTKRARYAAEAVQGIGGRPVARFARAAAKLQDVLGIHQDAVVASRWLRERSVRASGQVAFAAGAIAASCWTEAAAARKDWPRAWRRLEKRIPKEWS